MSLNPSLPALVEVDWLVEHFDDADLCVLDASWHMPDQNRDGELEWRQKRIPNALFFDFDRKVCRQDTELPHMFPDEATFNREVQALGVNQDSRIVIYDALGTFAAPRAWWMFRAMGHQQVAVLNGGLPAWQAAGQPVTSASDPLPKPCSLGNFQGRLQAEWLCEIPDVQQALTDASMRVIDVRPAERFNADVEEPRPGLRRGHMPGSLNLPAVGLYTTDLKMLPVEQLQQVFQQQQLTDPHQRLIFSCGSGVAACSAALAATLLGYDNLSVYDGSWTEWAQPDNGLPVTADRIAS